MVVISLLGMIVMMAADSTMVLTKIT